MILSDIRRIPGRFDRYPPDARLFWGIFRPVDVLCKKIQSVAGCSGGQIGGLAAAKGWSASRGLHQGIPRPSASAFAPVPPSYPRRRCTQSGDQRQDFGEQPVGHRDLSELERDVAAVTDDLRADFYQFLA